MDLAPCATSYPASETRTGHFALAARGELLDEAAQHDVVAIGPGMGLTQACARLVETALSEVDRPVVLDASGLTNLAGLGRVPRVTGPLVITPHPGEMAHLLEAFGLKIPLSSDDKSRKDAARAVAETLRCVVVLKGTRTVVTDGKCLYINTTGNPGLATGGTGDVLTGVTAGLLGQKFQPFEAACLACYLHGLAGDIGAKRLGQHSLMASDLLDTLPEALLQLARKKTARKPKKPASGKR
jgi:NAD(P)H-hydrate epimerase